MYGCVCDKCLEDEYGDCLCRSIYGEWKVQQFAVLQINPSNSDCDDDTMDTD